MTGRPLDENGRLWAAPGPSRGYQRRAPLSAGLKIVRPRSPPGPTFWTEWDMESGCCPVLRRLPGGGRLGRRCHTGGESSLSTHRPTSSLFTKHRTQKLCSPLDKYLTENLQQVLKRLDSVSSTLSFAPSMVIRFGYLAAAVDVRYVTNQSLAGAGAAAGAGPSTGLFSDFVSTPPRDRCMSPDMSRTEMSDRGVPIGVPGREGANAGV